jgi:succinate dehydrogenase / fumarate reductase, membrane anchor subunit
MEDNGGRPHHLPHVASRGVFEEKQLGTPLSGALGLGSAKEGVAHWWAQRVTAVALVPLLLWFAASIVSHAGADRGAVVAWLHAPFTGVVLLLLIIAGFYHMALGVQVVLEDYVHTEWVKLAVLVLNRFLCWGLGVASAYAVLRIAFGGA